MKTPSERRRARRRTRSLFDTAITIAIFIAIGVVVWVNWPSPPPPPIPLPSEPIALDSAAIKGDPAATVIVIQYTDFECPYCGAFARDVLPALDRQYIRAGKVRLAVYPLTPPTHRRALPAAVASECAGRQGRFWQMHDRLFADQKKLDDASLAANAEALGIDEAAFKACQGNPEIAERIGREMANARRLRIAGTPAFLIGTVQSDGRVKVTRSLRGAVSVAQLQEVLDAELGESSLVRLVTLHYPMGLAAVVVLGGSVFWLRRRRTRRTS